MVGGSVKLPLCKKHKIPIRIGCFKAGYRHKGCSLCFKEKFSDVLAPPPEDRLCKRHGKPIFANQWKSGHRNYGCCVCSKNNLKKTKKVRIKKWDSCFISCKRHLDKRCSKSLYVYGGKRRCYSCHSRRKDGTKRDCFIKNSNKANYDKSIIRRGQLRGRLRGWELFERSTGFKIPDEWKKHDVY